MRIRVGNQSSFSASRVELPFEFAVENGFDAFEWFPDRNESGRGWSEEDLSEGQRSHIKDTALAHGIALSVHAPWWANPLKDESLGILSRSMEFARDIGASLFNIHLYRDHGIQAFVRAISPLLDQLAPNGLRLSIENTPLTGPEDFNELFGELDVIGMAGAEHIGMCLDLGHANLCQATLNDYLKFIDRLASQIPVIHVHLHENYGDRDSHLPLFTGPAGRDPSGIEGFLKRMYSRRFAGCIIFEQWPEPPSLLLEARTRLLAMIDKVWEGSEQTDSLEPLENSKTPSTPRNRHDLGHNHPSTSSGSFHRHSGMLLAGIQKSDLESGSRPKACRDKLRHNDVEGHLREGQVKAPRADRICPEGNAVNDFVRTIAETDGRNRSWREKLRWIRDAVCDQSSPPNLEKLVYLAIYLRFIGTGQVSCQEDGHHYRPVHHANIARDIYDHLTRTTGPQNVLLVKRIVPWLPSSGNEFTRAEPLTLIRDIAHRNDIPRELKSEIKHTLQNKLHRCAGPEDLVTSSALLARITAPDACFSPAFAEEFKRFHEQLKEFFGARSLEEQLKAIANAWQPADARLIQAFLEAKSKADDPDLQLKALDSLTILREHLGRRFVGRTGAQSQELQLADIRLEEFAFVLLSRLINHFEGQGSAIPWSSGLKCLQLTAGNLRCSGLDPEECSAVESELDAWRRAFEARDRDQVLRLKATLDRIRRLTEEYCDTILELFPGRVEQLGRALGVPEQAIRVYAESEIRSHVVFQLSKILDLFSKVLRDLAGLSPWEVIVPGSATGLLVESLSLDHLPCPGKPVIALIERVEGDEEIPQDVSGVIVSRQTPYLSHFAVRARQTGVVYAACEEASRISKLRHLVGHHAIMKAFQGKVDVTLMPEAGFQLAGRPKDRNRLKPLIALEVVEPSALPLDRVTVTNGGAKALGARRLDELSRRDGAGFRTPKSLVVPFGVMEASLHLQPSLEEEYRHRLSCLERIPREDLQESLAELPTLIRKLEVPGVIISEIIRHFGSNGRLMARSSSNCEDLEELAGAGLYESVANVPPDRAADAIREVWASLWTQRAAIERQNCGIPHNRAFMAVLIQQMVTPDLSFIMHTVNPANMHPNEILVELASGMGETLAAAGRPGNPYRLLCSKQTGDVSMLAFASFSQAILPHVEGGVIRKTLDYSKMKVSMDTAYRMALGGRLATIGAFVEAALGSPQDIEGMVAGDAIYMVQSRLQQGIQR